MVGQKLLGQVAAAALLVAGGTRIEFVTNPLGGMVYIGWWGVLPAVILGFGSVAGFGIAVRKLLDRHQPRSRPK